MKDETLGDYLAWARTARGLTSTQLAKLVQVAPSQVTRWEQNKLTPNAGSLISLAEQLELRASDLFRLAGRPIPSDVRTIPAMLRAEYELPASAIKDIEEYIERVAERYQTGNTGKEEK